MSTSTRYNYTVMLPQLVYFFFFYDIFRTLCMTYAHNVIIILLYAIIFTFVSDQQCYLLINASIPVLDHVSLVFLFPNSLVPFQNCRSIFSRVFSPETFVLVLLSNIIIFSALHYMNLTIL